MFNLKGEKKSIKVLLIGTALFVLFFQLYMVLSHGNDFFLGSLEKMNNDDVKYIGTAWNLIDTGRLEYNGVGVPTVFIMPGHPVVLSGFMLIFGKFGGITAFRIFQIIIQLISIFLIFFIAREIFDSRVAIAACIIDALYIPELFSAGLILTEVEFKILTLFLVYVCIYAIKTKEMKYYIIGGVLWGVACLFRPVIAAFPAVILIMWLLYKYSFKEMMKFAIPVTLVFCLIMSPWWIRNYRDFNKFIPLTESSGDPFLQGTYIHYNYKKDDTINIGATKGLSNNEIKLRTGKARLKKYFKTNPVGYIYWYTIGKFAYLWGGPFYWKNVAGIPLVFVCFFHGLIILAAVPGIYRAIKKKNLAARMVLYTLLYFTCVYVPFFTCGRYSYPVMGLVIIFAADTVIKFMQKKEMIAA